MILSLSQVCTLHANFEQDVKDFAGSGCAAMEIWLTKLETYLESHTYPQAVELLNEHGVQVPVASFQGGLLASQGEQRREHWQHWQRRLEMCRQLEIGTIVVACDVPAPLASADLQRVQVSLSQLGQDAERFGVRAAIEFQASSAFGNNLQTMAALVEKVQNKHVGICLDAYHFFVGPSKLSDLACLNQTNLFHVQLSDLADIPRELATDSDRVLPGDGDIPLSQIIQRLRDIDYQCTVSVELMNPQIWQVPPRQFSEIGFAALQKVIESSEGS